MRRSPEGLGETVSPLLGRIDVMELDITHLHSFADDVMLDVDVLGPSMRGWVAGETNGGLVVDVQRCRTLLY